MIKSFLVISNIITIYQPHDYNDNVISLNRVSNVSRVTSEGYVGWSDAEDVLNSVLNLDKTKNRWS